MRSVSAAMNTPPRRERVIAVMWLASLVLWLATWGAAPWSWGYAVFTFVLGLIVGWMLRPPSPSSPYPLVPILIVIVGNQVSTHIFYPGDYPVAGDLHRAGVVGLLMASAIPLAVWLKRKRAGHMDAIEPPPVMREGQYLP